MLCVNGLKCGAEVDADWVEIVHASDEQIERFVMSIHNCTDQRRRELYARMVCRVGRETPSAHVLNMLRGTFAEVRSARAAGAQGSQGG